MAREISSGGVVLRRMQARWWVAVIEPQGKRAPGAPDRDAAVLALPKGLLDEGEKPEVTAVREVREETGVEASVVTKLRDIKYVYVRSWGDRQRVFKVVSFYLLLYHGGKLGEIAPDMRREVRQALWLPLEEAAQRLTYRGEREVMKLAEEYVAAHPEL